MRFWDASAVVPLIVEEPMAGSMKDLLKGDPEIVVWWAASISFLPSVPAPTPPGRQFPCPAPDFAMCDPGRTASVSYQGTFPRSRPQGSITLSFRAMLFRALGRIAFAPLVEPPTHS